MILEIEISFYNHRLINFWRSTLTVLSVVYLLIPTSNHNYSCYMVGFSLLYIFWFLHQTTTYQLHPTIWDGCISFDSYIKPQQLFVIKQINNCCISFDSYIKPQLNGKTFRIKCVVYLLIPTSNHNSFYLLSFKFKLYIFWFLHQTTTY